MRRPTRNSLGLLLVLSSLLSEAEPTRAVEETVPVPPSPRDRESVEFSQDEALADLEARLGLLARSMSDPARVGLDASGLVGERALATPLRPRLREQRVGDLTIGRPAAPAGEETVPVGVAIADLIAPFAGAQGVRVALELVQVLGWPRGPWTTRVAYEASGLPSRSRLQQRAIFAVDWSARRDEVPPRIDRIRLESFEEASAPRALFLDATGFVLPLAADPRRTLAFGADYWRGRLDAVGEPSLLGHQGLAVGDADGDGLEDLYVAMGNGLPNKLLMQQSDGTLRDVAFEAGVAWLDETKGVLFADTDNDKDQDLLVAIGPAIVLCKNDGHGKFEQIVGMRAPGAAVFHSLSVADYDLDGDLDVFGTRHSAVLGMNLPQPLDDASNGPPNHLLRNDGEDRFVDVTVEVGLDVDNHRFSVAGAWADYDGDGDPDLYVANEFGRGDLYRNEGGRFVEVAREAGLGESASSGGATWSDYDSDGDVDLYVTNHYSAEGIVSMGRPDFLAQLDPDAGARLGRQARGGSLHENLGDGTFRDATDPAGALVDRWAFGARFVDWNNDGHEDLVTPAGLVTGSSPGDVSRFFWEGVATQSVGGDPEGPARSGEAWKSLVRSLLEGQSWNGHESGSLRVQLPPGGTDRGRNGTRFADATFPAGLDSVDDGRAVVALDWDADGDLDLWLKNRTGPQLRFLENDAVGGRSVSLRLRGTTANRDAVGSWVELSAGKRVQRRTVTAGDGYLSQSSAWLHFGLGTATRIDRVVVHWAPGASEEIRGVRGGGRYLVTQGGGTAIAIAPRKIEIPATPAPREDPEEFVRVPLRVPLPIPPTIKPLIYPGGSMAGGKLLVLWNKDCEPCLDELANLAERYGDLRAQDVEVQALSLDPVEDQPRAVERFVERVVSRMKQGQFVSQAPSEDEKIVLLSVIEHVLGRPGQLPLPTSLLIDGTANLQVIHLGPSNVDLVLEDLRDYPRQGRKDWQRSAFRGRWYYRTNRDLMRLALELRDRGQRNDARFYLAVAELGSEHPPVQPPREVE